MMDPVTIDFIDGYLTALSHLCPGCDFVPLYGAVEIDLCGENVNAALVTKYGSSVTNVALRDEDTKTLLSVLLEQWVNSRLFEGSLKTKKVSTRNELYQLRSYLEEFIEDLVSQEYDLYSFKIDHRDFGYETEALCFHGNGRCLFVYFGWSD